MHSLIRSLERRRRHAGFSRTRQSGGAEAGFTLLELMVVIVIIGLLVGLVAPAVLHQLGNARVSVTRLSIERLGSVLDMYKLDTGSYPTTDEGLQALVTAPADASNWNGPYVKNGTSLADQWNHPFIYSEPSNRPNHDYDLCSAGPNNDVNDPTKQICNK